MVRHKIEVLRKYESNVTMKGAKMHVAMYKRSPKTRKLQDKASIRDNKQVGHPAKYVRLMSRKNKNKTRNVESKLPTFGRKASSKKHQAEASKIKERTPLFPLLSSKNS